MSSDIAVISGQGSGIGWQVNIPSFGSLALNLGVAAMKQLATAGVSEHTLQCMLMIAEVCPASNEYRKEISMCRQEQRKTAIWIYKVVELGTATNFVADELLKSRAGENVVALMSALLPVMSEESSDAVILKLFDRRGASLNTTPGYSQLRSFRTILAPLLRKTEFKDKAFQYHSLLKRLLVDNKSLPSTSLDEVYHSIPSEETMVHIIQLLSELVQEGDRKILAYHGLKGAAWCIAYARHVLGLAVCILRTRVDLVPINGDYNNARVLVYIFEEESRCDILLQGKVTDFFDIKGLESSEFESQYGWAIDANKTNLLDCYLPASEFWRTRAVDIVTSLVHAYTEFIARQIHGEREDQELEKTGLVKYSVYCLPAIRRRASKILEMLGFGSHHRRAAEAGVWRQYVTILKPKLSEPEAEDACSPSHLFHLTPGPAWLSSPPTQYKTCRGSRPLQRTSEDGRPPSVHEALEFDDDEISHIAFLLRTVVAVSWLAFTNWDEYLHIISVTFLERKDGWYNLSRIASLKDMLLSYGQDVDHISSRYASGEVNMQVGGMRRKNPRKGMVGTYEIIGITAMISLDGFHTRSAKFDDSSTLAVHNRGFIVARNPAIQQSLDTEASYVFFMHGSISANGERREVISSNPSRYIGSLPAQEPVTHYQPTDMFPTLKLSTRAQLLGSHLEIYQDVLIKDKISLTSPLTYILVGLGQLYVTNGCDHSYYNEFQPLQSDNYKDQSPQIGIVKQGMFAIDPLLERPTERNALTCYLQAVDQNGCGQWVACGVMAGRTRLTILQRNTCLQCTCRMAEQNYLIAGGDLANVCVIPGRLKDEPMD